jgi:phosphoesterase RecJ-like protein
LLHRLDIEVDRDIATCLYTGLVTDTGRFQYRNTTKSVHDIAGDLIARGAPHDEISRIIYDTHPVGFLKLAARALERLEIRDGIAWTFVTMRDMRENHVEVEDIESLIDLVRTADSADVAAVLKEQEDGRYKVSMRSKGATNIGAVCESFGGGGHALAAGFTSRNGDPSATIDEISAAIASQRAPAHS